MKKIVKIIAISLALTTTTFAMEENFHDDSTFDTLRVVRQAICAGECLHPNYFSDLATAHMDDPETAALCTTLHSQLTRLNAEFLPSIMENLIALGRRFDSPLRDIENGIPMLSIEDIDAQLSNNAGTLYEPTYEADGDEEIQPARRGRADSMVGLDENEINAAKYAENSESASYTF